MEMKQGKKGRPFRAALIQLCTGTDYAENIRKIGELVRRAADGGADFVILPETADRIGPRTEDAPETNAAGTDAMNPAAAGTNATGTNASGTDAAETGAAETGAAGTDAAKRDYPAFCSSLARTYGVWLNCGSFSERTDGEKTRNTSILFDDSGRWVADYSKLHLFDMEEENGPCFHESQNTAPGDHLTLVDTPFGTLGMAICYDVRFPVIFHTMARRGAGIFTLPANFTLPTGKAHWESLLRARAIENSAYVIACNQCGVNTACEAYGHSMVVDPWGQVIAQAGDGEEILFAEIDPSEISRIRAKMPSLSGARTDLFRVECNRIEYR